MQDPTRRAGSPPRSDRVPDGGSGLPAAVDRPRVALCDEGELEDVYQILRALDVAPLRLRPGDLDDLRDWERPSQLLITSVRVALAHGLPPPAAAPGCVSIAVADGDARSQCVTMLGRGFRYVVRRPVHPEALRLLVMQVLWRGREHRVVARFPFGAEIGWRRGLRRGRCTMVEISAHGCRLLSRAPLRPGDRLRLRVPAVLTGSRDLRLRGRVVRSERPAPGDGASERRIGVRFERLSGRSLAHLDALLAERASGPARMTQSDPDGQGPAPQRTPAPQRGGGPRLALGRTAEPRPAAPAKPSLERRRRPRGVWQREVVALDRESDRVLHTLLGSDLSTGGLRVEANPLLRLGDRLRLALYDASDPEPLVLEARVAHDEGRRGVGLVFVDPDEVVRERLDRMVSGLPPLVEGAEGGERPKDLVLGEIVALTPATRSAGPVGEGSDAPSEHDQD